MIDDSDDDGDVKMDEATMTPIFVYDPDANAALKGRKRFKADLNDLKEACEHGLCFDGLKVSSESVVGMVWRICYSDYVCCVC